MSCGGWGQGREFEFISIHDRDGGGGGGVFVGGGGGGGGGGGVYDRMYLLLVRECSSKLQVVAKLLHEKTQACERRSHEPR